MRRLHCIDDMSSHHHLLLCKASLLDGTHMTEVLQAFGGDHEAMYNAWQSEDEAARQKVSTEAFGADFGRTLQNC